MDNNLVNKKLSRRAFLKTTTLLAGIAVVPVAMISKEVFAALMAKATMQYQDHPKDPNRHCSKCIHFKPGKTAEVEGACEVVEGPISPNGWCMAFSPKAV